MQRRTFLKSALLLSGSALTGMWPRGVAAASPTEDFSLDVVTARPGEAIRRLSALLREAAPGRHIHVSETPLAGRLMGDLAYVRGNRLIDFRRHDDAFSRALTGIARALDLPREVAHPVLVRFHTHPEGTRARRAQVFVDDVLVEELDLTRSHPGRRIHGVRGHVDLRIHDHSVQVVGASCRHRTCMQMGALRSPGQPLVCIPARLHVVLAGPRPLGVDGITF